MTTRHRLLSRRLFTVAALIAISGGAGCSSISMSPAAPPKTVLRVATSGDYSPFSLKGGGGLDGFDIDVAKRLSDDLGLRLETVTVSWPTLLAATRRGDFDIAMGGVTMRADRALVGRYTRPYAAVGIVALVREAYVKRFTQSDGLNQPGVRIAVNAGGHLERVARERFPRARIDAIPDNQALPKRLLDGKADAVITDTAEARDWLRGGLRVVGPFRFDYKAYLLPVGEKELALRVDEWMVARETDGWLPAQREKWLGSQATTNPATATREAIAALIGLRLDLMLPMAAAKQAAGKAIDDPGREEDVLKRVRGESTRPDYTAAVYKQLFVLAKTVQRNAPAGQAPASIDEIRAAIQRVDDQLVREMDRGPRVPTETWQGSLSRAVHAPGIDKDALQNLALALAES